MTRATGKVDDMILTPHGRRFGAAAGTAGDSSSSPPRAARAADAFDGA